MLPWFETSLSVLFSSGQPAAPEPPRIIFLEQPFSWVPSALAFLQFLILAVLTYYIFRSNSAKKIKERHADWYHKLVVDAAVSKLVEFIDLCCDELKASAKSIQDLKAGDALSGEIDDYVTDNVLKNFKDKLRRVRRYLCAQVSVFDKPLERCVFDRFMKLEDDVTAWFSREAQAEADEGRTPLSELVIGCGADILNELRNYEFSKWS